MVQNYDPNTENAETRLKTSHQLETRIFYLRAICKILINEKLFMQNVVQSLPSVGEKPHDSG